MLFLSVFPPLNMGVKEKSMRWSLPVELAKVRFASLVLRVCFIRIEAQEAAHRIHGIPPICPVRSLLNYSQTPEMNLCS